VKFLPENSRDLRDSSNTHAPGSPALIASWPQFRAVICRSEPEAPRCGAFAPAPQERLLVEVEM
jgi:hypothetical protein